MYDIVWTAMNRFGEMLQFSQPQTWRNVFSKCKIFAQYSGCAVRIYCKGRLVRTVGRDQ